MFARRIDGNSLMFWVVCVNGLAFISDRATAQEKVSVSREELIQKIREREDRVKSAKIEWVQERFLTAGAGMIPEYVNGETRMKAVPEKDETTGSKHIFSFDDKRTRHWTSEYDREQGNVTKVESLETYDGQRNRFLWGPNALDKFPKGRIEGKSSNHRQFANLEIQPILVCYRLFLRIGRPLVAEELKIERTDVEVDGVRCIVASFPAGTSTRRFWIDPSRDYVVVRSTMQEGELIQFQIDLSYRSDGDQRWNLSGWNIKSYSARKLIGSYAAKMTRRSKLNPQLPDSDFMIEFPPGAWVNDLSDHTSFIQLSDGRQRQVLESESRVPYEKLLKTEPGHAVPSTEPRIDE